MCLLLILLLTFCLLQSLAQLCAPHPSYCRRHKRKTRACHVNPDDGADPGIRRKAGRSQRPQRDIGGCYGQNLASVGLCWVPTGGKPHACLFAVRILCVMTIVAISFAQPVIFSGRRVQAARFTIRYTRRDHRLGEIPYK